MSTFRAPENRDSWKAEESYENMEEQRKTSSGNVGQGNLLGERGRKRRSLYILEEQLLH